MAGQRAGEPPGSRPTGRLASGPAGRRAGGRAAAEGKTGETPRGNNESLAFALAAKRGSVTGGRCTSPCAQRPACGVRWSARSALSAWRSAHARCWVRGARRPALGAFACSVLSGGRCSANGAQPLNTSDNRMRPDYLRKSGITSRDFPLGFASLFWRVSHRTDEWPKLPDDKTNGHIAVIM